MSNTTCRLRDKQDQGLFPLLLLPAVAEVYIVSFRTHDDRRPSKFMVLADNMKSASNMAWEHGGRTFKRGLIRAPHKPLEMTKGALRVL
jgi:hypothetical protein